jgi:hypothetical protein
LRKIKERTARLSTIGDHMTLTRRVLESGPPHMLPVRRGKGLHRSCAHTTRHESTVVPTPPCVLPNADRVQYSD